METTQRRVISEDLYRILRSTRLSKAASRKFFEYNVETLVAEHITTYGAADRFRKIQPDHIFLWVPSIPRDLTLRELMGMIELDGQRGVSCLGKKHYQDDVTIPLGPYLMLNIEDGSRRLNIEPTENVANFRRERRSAYTVLEAVIHCIVYPKVLLMNNIDICGSHSELGDILHLYKSSTGPTLGTYLNGRANPHWGAASCKKRLGIESLRK